MSLGGLDSAMAGMTDIEGYWEKVCGQNNRQIWRWTWEDSLGRPRRYTALKSAQDKVEQEDGRWFLRGKGGKDDKEVILDTDVPKRFLVEWNKKGSQGNQSFEQKWREEKEGVLREHLRELIKLASAAPMTIVKEGAYGGEIGWTTGLRVEASWNSRKRVLLSVSPAEQSSAAKAVEIIKGGKDIIFITGAGISTAAGIPDFRSWKGIFSTSGKDVFESNILRSAEGLKRHNREMGCLAQKAMQAIPTAFHHMLAYLGEERTQPLVRHYTQNVDGLESSFQILHTTVPLSRGCEKLNIQLHGNLRTTKCNVCNETADLDPEQHINDTGLECWNCMRINPEKGNRRKRTIGKVRPNIVLYMDEVDRDAEERLKVIKKDSESGKGKTIVDTLVVAGTSAKLPEVQNLVKQFSSAIKSRTQRTGRVVWIGLQPPPGGISKEFDEVCITDCEVVAQYFFDGVDFSGVRGRQEE